MSSTEAPLKMKLENVILHLHAQAFPTAQTVIQPQISQKNLLQAHIKNRWTVLHGKNRLPHFFFYFWEDAFKKLMNAVRLKIHVVLSTDLSQPKTLGRIAFTRQHGKMEWEGFFFAKKD